MFRNPRENVSGPANSIKPSVGRPPTPPTGGTVPHLRSNLAMATSLQASPSPSQFQTQTIPQKKTPLKNGRNKVKANASILSFFKKAESNDNDVREGLFWNDRNTQALVTDISENRYNENEVTSKRRRLSSTSDHSDTVDLPSSSVGTSGYEPEKATTTKRSRGPFLEDSDSDVEVDEPHTQNGQTETVIDVDMDLEPYNSLSNVETDLKDEEEREVDESIKTPALLRASTSIAEGDGFDDFEGLEDFDDEYDEGEEFVERRWMLEQRRIELAEKGIETDLRDPGFDIMDYNPEVDQELVPACPICNASFQGISDQEASVHVNGCLDGKPTPLSTIKTNVEANAATVIDSNSFNGNFRRPPKPAKPGQADPFELGSIPGSSSAFSKLMSGHAEDAAWASAAAAEYAARGKPAYQRTCPFYKILPGLFICVDAFRYGAVQGCHAYFLSHFHSDHYVGLTSTWCHGPIYCSRATGNLVRQQLRVDPKWVVDLEFEKKSEVPNTNGVQVTMIPANHCPGSSLFLFEKVVGQGKNPKVQRILHCGDFRACPAHVEHPLLRPDAIDSMTGKTFQQKIDVCYLDTTYLNPKYSFPSQEDVIKACADMCVSLNKSKVDEQDGWEQMKKERAGNGMVKFVQKEPANMSKEGAELSDPETATMTKNRGRLLVVVGTYSIGKERICLGIARALDSKIYAPPPKQRICACLEDPELNARLTTDPREAQVHMTPLFEIRAETLGDYLAGHEKSGFTRAVGFRPSGWNYRPPNSRFTESPAVSTVLHSESWKSGFSMKDLVPQRGSSSRVSCFGVPYSEHSSFRELTMFCCALRIDRVIPTVNIGSAKSREKMKAWVEKWAMERKKNGLFKVAGESGKGGWYAGHGTMELRTTL